MHKNTVQYKVGAVQKSTRTTTQFTITQGLCTNLRVEEHISL